MGSPSAPIATDALERTTLPLTGDPSRVVMVGPGCAATPTLTSSNPASAIATRRTAASLR